MAFHIGQKVVCVDDEPSPMKDIMLRVRSGDIYIIRGFDRFLRRGARGVYLEGIYSRDRRGGRGDGEEVSWNPLRFRPLVERKTDISIFTAMLRKHENVA